jgi:peptide/nickel transport system permease protein
VLAAIFAPLIAPDDPNSTVAAPFLKVGSPGHLLGTDDLGRDELSRVLYGARLSLGLALGTVAIAALIGITLGLLAGYYRWLDGVTMRSVNLILALPGILLALLIGTVIGAGAESVMIAVSVFTIPSFVRVVRGVTLSTRDLEYVEAAKVLGIGDFRILWRYILPAATGPLIVQTSFNVAAAILTIGSLSFIGLGIAPPTAEWGSMLSADQSFMQTSPQLMIVPGAAIFITVFALNIVGDGIRDLLDPRLRSSVANA